MSLLVHYQNLKHFDADKCQWLGEKGQNAIDQKDQADHIGWLMMAVGVYEITEKTIDVYNSGREAHDGGCRTINQTFLSLLSISDYDNDGNLNMFTVGRSSDRINEWIWNGSKFIKVSP